jgi:hypothetical protein
LLIFDCIGWEILSIIFIVFVCINWLLVADDVNYGTCVGIDIFRESIIDGNFIISIDESSSGIIQIFLFWLSDSGINLFKLIIKGFLNCLSSNINNIDSVGQYVVIDGKFYIFGIAISIQNLIKWLVSEDALDVKFASKNLMISILQAFSNLIVIFIFFCFDLLDKRQ